MQLIRKRLKVEFWVDDQLRCLYDLKVNIILSINYKIKKTSRSSVGWQFSRRSWSLSRRFNWFSIRYWRRTRTSAISSGKIVFSRKKKSNRFFVYLLLGEINECQTISISYNGR